MATLTLCDVCGKNCDRSEQTQIVVPWYHGRSGLDVPHEMVFCKECVPADLGKDDLARALADAFSKAVTRFRRGGK